MIGVYKREEEEREERKWQETGERGKIERGGGSGLRNAGKGHRTTLKDLLSAGPGCLMMALSKTYGKVTTSDLGLIFPKLWYRPGEERHLRSLHYKQIVDNACKKWYISRKFEFATKHLSTILEQISNKEDDTSMAHISTV